MARRLAPALPAALVALVAGCAAGPAVDRSFVAAGQDSRAQFVILHATWSDFDTSLRLLTQGEVSSHYLVRDDPVRVYGLVDESRRAWHAGESSWQGHAMLNAASIGIEIVNAGDSLAAQGIPWQEYPEAQVEAVIALVKDIAARHAIRPDRILGHSDVAPQRKSDPGPRFPWKRLADAGLIPWPDGRLVAERRPAHEARLPGVDWFQARLQAQGYAIPVHGRLDEATRRVVAAFQMKYRPARFDGTPDAETAAILEAMSPAPAGGRGALDAELAAILDDPRCRLASLSAGVLRGGAVAYEGALGRRRIDASDPAADRPADADTLYRVASVSKLATALGVMRLAEAGRVDLDRDVSDYLGYRLRNPRFPDDAITLRMLLAHTSSLRDEGGYFWDARHRLRDALLPGGSLHGDGRMWAANARPGAWFSYANLGYGVVGEVMEAVTGERFDRLMQRLVLGPLGVPGGYSPADLSPAALASVATLYRKDSPDGPWLPQVDDYANAAPVPRAGPGYVPGTNGTLFAPQGGLRTSVAGLARIMRMLLDGGTIDGTPFLRPETVDLMLARAWTYDPQAPNGDPGSGSGQDDRLFNAWGLGNQHFLDVTGPGRGDRLVAEGGLEAAGHLGDAYGLTAAFVFDRARRLGLIAVVGGAACDERGRHSALGRHEERILDALYRFATAPP